MQTCLRNGQLARCHAALAVPSTSRAASAWSPLNWVKETLAPAIVEKQSAKEVEAAKQIAKEQGTTSVFDALPKAVVQQTKKESTKFTKEKATSHKYSTANFKISHRKLNMLGRQISGKPIDYAILQMQFSEKRASSRIMNMLATARDHATRYKKLDPSKLVVSQAWVSKGPRPPKMIEPRGRGHFGVRIRNNAKMSVVLEHGKTLEERKTAAFQGKLKRIVSGFHYPRGPAYPQPRTSVDLVIARPYPLFIS
ncbi:mitochondrial 50S ribosomal protein L22 [Ephemerocybe angulata]|uniref:Mitochondrial 50S ribosomal protein L22 n=1 Tax=Ephemerocybe angulata TaxID=980116 RepID=A0A8H6MBT8_9AGAR|nr:mitochondrial 50S ribosomal protein L22 [Tulosesus angulatus]